MEIGTEWSAASWYSLSLPEYLTSSHALVVGVAIPEDAPASSRSSWPTVTGSCSRSLCDGGKVLWFPTFLSPLHLPYLRSLLSGFLVAICVDFVVYPVSLGWSVTVLLPTSSSGVTISVLPFLILLCSVASYFPSGVVSVLLCPCSPPLALS